MPLFFSRKKRAAAWPVEDLFLGFLGCWLLGCWFLGCRLLGCLLLGLLGCLFHSYRLLGCLLCCLLQCFFLWSLWLLNDNNFHVILYSNVEMYNSGRNWKQKQNLAAGFLAADFLAAFFGVSLRLPSLTIPHRDHHHYHHRSLSPYFT